MVVLLALFFSAILDADSLVASISSEKFGTSRSIELALVKPFRAVSNTLGLNLPHRWLADVGGTNQRHLGDAAAALAAHEAAVAAQNFAIQAMLQPHTGVLRANGVAVATTVPPPPPPVQPRVPTPADPMRIWLAGDSLMGMLSDAFVNDVAGNPAISASVDVQVGTGLARPDVYDWPDEVAEVLQQQQPNVVVLTFGANDDQAMAYGNGYVEPGTQAWDNVYTQRVAGIMNEVSATGALLIWVQVPPVDRPPLQANDQVINAIVGQQAAKHSGVVVLNPTSVVAPGGKFSEFLPGPGGAPIQIRDTDGVHLTFAGAELVLPLLLHAMASRWIVH